MYRTYRPHLSVMDSPEGEDGEGVEAPRWRV